MSLDATQVQLQLTNEKFVLNELRRKHRLVTVREDGKDVDVFKIQFDSRTFEFRAGRIITVGKSIGECLMNDAHVIVGPAIDGEVHPVLKVVREFALSDGERAANPTTCLFCNEDMGTVTALVDHLIEAHGNEDGKKGKAAKAVAGGKGPGATLDTVYPDTDSDK